MPESNAAQNGVAHLTPSITSSAKSESTGAVLEMTKQVSNLNPLEILKLTIGEATKVADKGVITTLVTAGFLFPVLALLMRLKGWQGHPVTDLAPSEFGFVLLLSGVCLISATLARVFTYYCQHTLDRDTLKAKMAVLSASAGTTEKGLQAATEIAKANASIAEKAIEAGEKQGQLADKVTLPGQSASSVVF